MTDQAPALNFTSFVFSLMHTAAVHLGDAIDPSSGQPAEPTDSAGEAEDFRIVDVVDHDFPICRR